MKTCLSIAGSDSSGGAGIQADLKTMLMHGVFGMSAITALTAQNTVGVTAIMETPADFLKAQMDAVFTDIRPDAVKVGMVSSPELAAVIAERLRFYKAENIVLDPVMIATSGASLIQERTLSFLREQLFPLATVLTPNLAEAEILAGFSVKTYHDMEKAAERVGKSYGCAVLVKGGHSLFDANDCLYKGGQWFCLPGTRIDNPNTHGTGCTLSSAIASNLALGYSLVEAVIQAKNYVRKALMKQLDLGSGSGPLNHFVSNQ